nr:MAG TPA: hypothetical protein [Caudoviricetes sp.]
MILSTTKELRLHNPSNAVDEVNLLQGILDNSEKDFLREKLGGPLYTRLCDYYESILPDDFFLAVTGGNYQQDPFAVLLLYAQRVVVNDALMRYVYQQALSVNGAGVNMAGGDDYSSASDKMIDKAVQGYKKEAFSSLNALLVMLEEWAKETDGSEDDAGYAHQQSIREIVKLWRQSKYYYLHSELLIPTCTVLQRYLDIYENRDKFIRLLPDLLFIQEEYIEDIVGADMIKQLLRADEHDRLLKKVRRLMVAYLEERTTVLNIDKTRRMQAHNEGVALKSSILSVLSESKKDEPDNSGSMSSTPADENSSQEDGFKNNQAGSKIFVSPLLY